jgi:tetratricopeptide (TPR) repeat protein
MKIAMTSRRFAVPAALILVALLALPVQGDGQAARRPPAAPSGPETPLQAAMRAFNEGRYGEVDGLTAGLDASAPAVVAVRGRALIARGLYAEAEEILRPVATRAPASDAALELGLLLQMLTKPDADGVLEGVAGDRSNEPAAVARQARALRALGEAKDANVLYQQLASVAPRDAAVNAAWGELFLQTYNKREALKSFQDALDADATYVPALLGSAYALADEDPPQAAGLVKRALQVNPSSVDAHVFLASQAIDQSRHDEARQSLQQALRVNPASLDAHALLAALAYVNGATAEYEAEVARTLAIAPGYGEVYRLAGEMAARNYLFDDAVALIRKGHELDPENARILADLGAQLLRTGDEPAARVALEQSFDLDPYSVVTFNLLAMMDTLDTFETFTDGAVTLRLSPAEAPVLREPALRLANDALETLAAKYDVTLKGPVLLEIFPKHDDFAVRVAGLPGMIGALGACFGDVVIMDSPKARQPGEFQWEGTLYHELAHVITLQLSDQRIPRWLTEGISEYEEKLARPEWGRGMEMQFAELMTRGEVLKLNDLNAAFTDPKTIAVAYYQATQLVEYLAKTFGDAGIRTLVQSFATPGTDTNAGLKRALNTDLDALQSGFDGFLADKFGALRAALDGPDESELQQMPLEALRAHAEKNTGSYRAQMALGRQLVEANDVPGAVQAFDRAAAAIPSAAGPHAAIAEIALETNDKARAVAALKALVANDFNNIGAARRLAGLLRDMGTTDPAVTQPVYARIAALDPFDAEARAVLGRNAMARGDAEAASREFRAVIALGPVDRAAAHTDLAESYFRAGNRVEAKRQTLAALEVAPTYSRAQDLLLKLAAPEH